MRQQVGLSEPHGHFPPVLVPSCIVQNKLISFPFLSHLRIHNKPNVITEAFERYH